MHMGKGGRGVCTCGYGKMMEILSMCIFYCSDHDTYMVINVWLQMEQLVYSMISG